MTMVEESVEVGAPVPVVFGRWTRFEEFPLFVRGVLQVDRPEPDLTRWTVRAGGSTREFDARITELIPDERVAWASVAGDLRQAGVVTFHQLEDDRTRLMLQLYVEPHGLVDRVGDVLGFVHRRALDGLADFKAFVEAGAAAGPAAAP
ncbi:SRPBCC family protein [Kitasatospora sp. NBC_01539]|uniref:SRPBCC family protein n=1 Tax=Kitasatospora sp. NBC_01539 TaxID=2903577 RepID=UPI00386010D7